MFRGFSRKNTERSALPLITAKDAPFDFVEAYKSLRTNLDFLMAEKHYHSLLITSPSPKDGKSTVALNLAIAMGEIGKNVILVDGDMRKGMLTRYLKTNLRQGGITGVLADEKTPEETILHREDWKIDLLPVGSLPNNPAELVGSPGMEKLLQHLKTQYDLMIIDTPAVSLVTDAAILSRIVDGVLLVARWDVTAKQTLNLSKKKLEDVNANILGVLLNDYSMKKHSEPHWGYYASGDDSHEG